MSQKLEWFPFAGSWRAHSNFRVFEVSPTDDLYQCGRAGASPAWRVRASGNFKEMWWSPDEPIFVSSSVVAAQGWCQQQEDKHDEWDLANATAESEALKAVAEKASAVQP